MFLLVTDASSTSIITSTIGYAVSNNMSNVSVIARN